MGGGFVCGGRGKPIGSNWQNFAALNGLLQIEKKKIRKNTSKRKGHMEVGRSY